MNEEEHYTEEDFQEKGCWCNPKMIFVEETETWVIVHDTLLKREDLDEKDIN